MSDSRKPPISQVSTSLSERIAALQRKSSASGINNGKQYDLQGNSASTPLSSAPSSPSRSFSASPGPYGRTPGTPDSALGLGPPPHNSASPRSVSSLHPASAAVRERIARFQTSSADADEKPLVPRSSFGAPAPNPELLTVRKAYPGAAGSGTGSWGEGVLRPQQTGGTWGSSANSGGLRAQLTGGAWAAAATAREYTASNGARWGQGQRVASGEDSPIVGSGSKDAFAELDDDAVRARTRTTSGADTIPSPFFSKLSVEDTPVGSRRHQDENAAQLPSLPDAPTTPVTERPGGDRSVSVDLGTVEENVTVPAFPSTPIGLGAPPSRTRADAVSDGGPVEIGVNSPKPGGFEALQRRVSEGLSGDKNDSDVFGLKPAPVLAHDAALDLPSRAGVERTDSGKVDSTDPAAHEVRGPELLVPRDEVAEQVARKEEAAALGDSKVDGSASSMSSYARTAAGVSASDIAQYRSGLSIENLGTAKDERAAVSNGGTPSSPAFTSPSRRPNGRPSHARENTSGTSVSLSHSATRSTPASSPSNSRPTSPISNAQSPNIRASAAGGGGVEAASRAREAIALARTKSQQKIKRLPPGRTLSAAEMDASDDDYEPGWASVISRTN